MQLPVLCSVFFLCDCTLRCGFIRYPHIKILFQRLGYLILTFFVLGSLLVTGSHACNTASIVHGEEAVRLQSGC